MTTPQWSKMVYPIKRGDLGVFNLKFHYRIVKLKLADMQRSKINGTFIGKWPEVERFDLVLTNRIGSEEVISSALSEWYKVKSFLRQSFLPLTSTLFNDQLLISFS